MSKLLINESPLQVLPTLAKAIGLNEAIVLQQVHYWLNHATTTHKGQKYVYKTVNEWQAEFPFWSERTIKTAFANLKAAGLILVEKLSKDNRNRVNYYSVDYEKLAELESTLCPVHGAKVASSKRQELPVVDGAKVARCYTENTQENTSESESAPANDYPPFEFKSDDRFLNFLQLNITTLPNDWKADALAKYPELNEQSLTDMFNAFEANHKHETGRVHTLAQWRGRWGIWFAKDASMAIRKQPKAQTLSTYQPNQSKDRIVPPEERLPNVVYSADGRPLYTKADTSLPQGSRSNIALLH